MSNEYRVLAGVYQLLAEHEAADFLRAADQMRVEPELRRALHALAVVRTRGSRDGPSRRATGAMNGEEQSLATLKNAARRVLGTDVVFGTNTELADFLNSAGFSRTFRSKDGRHRMERWALKELDERGRNGYAEFLERVQRLDPQTAGWRKAIRQG